MGGETRRGRRVAKGVGADERLGKECGRGPFNRLRLRDTPAHLEATGCPGNRCIRIDAGGGGGTLGGSHVSHATPSHLRPDPTHTARRVAATLLAGLGLGLALWLAVLKLWRLPCIGGGCEQVIHSQFGSVRGIPVGVFGVVAWTALFFPLSDRARTAWHAVLGLGAIGFMLVQFGLLKAFCPYCTAHAAAAIMAWPRRALRPMWWGLVLGGALAAGGYLLAARAVEARVGEVGRPAALAAGAEAFFPLDDEQPVAGARPVLVLSVTCPACLDLLAAVTNATWPAGKIGPAIYVKSEARDRALAAVWIAACTETKSSPARDRFMAVTAMLVGQRELVASDPEAAAAWLAGIFQPSAEARRAAETRLEQHAVRLAEAKAVMTPMLWPVGGKARADVVPADLWR